MPRSMMDAWRPPLFRFRNPVSYYLALSRGEPPMETAGARLGITRRRRAERAVRWRMLWTVVGRAEAMTALGLALLVVAVVLLLAEAHLSTGGLMGVGAGAAAIGGSGLLLVAAGAGAAVVLIVALCTSGAAIPLLLLARRRILRPKRARPRTGREGLVGHVGVIRSSGGPQSQVFVDGSLWRAEANPVHEEPALHAGDRGGIERVNGFTLCVRRAEEWELNP